MADFGDLRSNQGLQALNKFLLTRSYIEGFKPSAADQHVFSQTGASIDEAKFPHVARWHKHISSFTQWKRTNVWGGGKDAKGGAPGGAKVADDDEDKKAVPASKGKSEGKSKAKAKESVKEQTKEKETGADAPGDDGDPFAEPVEKSPFEVDDSDMTEEEKKKEADIAAKAKKLMDERAKKGKKKEAARSTLILDVKPLGDDTDMKELEAEVRKIDMEGLRWAGSELVPIGYGIKKLRIISVIVDDLVSTDVLREKIEAMETMVQSTDIFAFNKV